MDLDAYLAMLCQRGAWSGSVLVNRAGQTLLDASYGLAAREPERPNTPETAFQIASISKQFAAAAVLLLQEHGALSLHDTLGRWMPECPTAWEPITLHHLLTHTSGMGHWHDFPSLILEQPISQPELLRVFQQVPLKFAPGSKWAYSSPGYVLLAHVVEQVSGDPYAHFLRRAIFDPLVMDNAGAGNHAPRPDREAVGHAGKRMLPSFELDIVSMGAGDVWSTSGDLARWDVALLTPGRLLNAESLRVMFSPHATVANGFSQIPGARYGYGWLIAELGGQTVYFHPGDNAGFGALNFLLPDSGTMLILLSNDEDVDLWKIGRRVLREVLAPV